MNTLNVNFTYEVKNHDELNSTFDFEFSDGQTIDDVKESIAEQINDDADTDEIDYEITADDITLTDFECDEDIHEDYNSIDEDKKNIFDYAEIFCACEQDADIVNAAIDCDIQGSDIDEAYSGQFDNDEDFAQNMAEDIGAINKDATWPNNCIDWEQAASELMYDYSESNGYYFRCL